MFSNLVTCSLADIANRIHRRQEIASCNMFSIYTESKCECLTVNLIIIHYDFIHSCSMIDYLTHALILHICLKAF